MYPLYMEQEILFLASVILDASLYALTADFSERAARCVLIKNRYESEKNSTITFIIFVFFMYDKASTGEESIMKNPINLTLNTIYPRVPDITSRFIQNNSPNGMSCLYFCGFSFLIVRSIHVSAHGKNSKNQ